MANNTTMWPPDTFCFLARQAFVADQYNCNSPSNFTVTDRMVDFLNLTHDATGYIHAYCIHPPQDDSCPFGYCPNPDIDGPLIRTSLYITNICLAILIFYAPRKAEEAFWCQALSAYSLLITCGICIIQVSLTRFHAGITVVLTGSPLSLYLLAYAIASFWYKDHRLTHIMGKGHLLKRIAVVVAGALWISLLIFILLPKHYRHFSQMSCETELAPLASYLYAYPFRVLPTLTSTPWLLVLIVAAIVAVVLSWVIAILLQRDAIWPPGEPWSPRFVRTWSVVGDHYSFIHFVSFVVIPMLYWISVVEIGSFLAQNDQEWELSFPVLMASFLAVPPLLQMLSLYRMPYDWFMNLFWVRRLIARRQRKRAHMDRVDLNASPPASVPRDGDVELKDDLESVLESPSLHPTYDHYSRVFIGGK